MIVLSLSCALLDGQRRQVEHVDRSQPVVAAAERAARWPSVHAMLFTRIFVSLPNKDGMESPRASQGLSMVLPRKYSSGESRDGLVMLTLETTA